MSGAVRPLQIVGAALFAGPVILLAVAIFLRDDPDRMLVERSDERRTVTWTSLLVAFAVVGASVFLPRPKGGDIGRIRGHFVTRLALVEGGALFAAVAYFLERETFSIGLAALCLAVMAALHFPTRERVERLRSEPS